MKYFLSTNFSGAGNGPGYLAKYIYENAVIPCVGYDVNSNDGNILIRNRYRKYLGYFGVSIDLWLTLRDYLDSEPKLIFNSSPLIWLFLFVYKPNKQFILINDYGAITAPFSLLNRYYLRQWLIGRIEKLAAYRGVNVIYNSHYTKRIFERSTKPKGNSKIIYKGVDLSKYPVLKKRINLNARINLLYIKSDVRIGNLDILLSFLEKEEERYHLHVVGPSLNDFKKILRGRILPITFHGKLNTEEIIELCCRTIDVAVLLSSKEALGLALIEMLSMCIPVVSSNVGGMNEVSDGGTFTFNVREVNEVELAIVCDKIRKNVSELDLLIGSEYVRNKFSITHTLNEYLQL